MRASWVILVALLLLGPAWRALAQNIAVDAEINAMHLSLHHVTLSVIDVTRESEWYERVLGFRESRHLRRLPDFESIMVDIPGYRIELAWQKGSYRPRSSRPSLQQGWLHMVFQTSVIDETYRRLIALGVEVNAERSPDTHTLRRMTIFDPEGNEIEISAQP